jgi:hypothetical protein
MKKKLLDKKKILVSDCCGSPLETCVSEDFVGDFIEKNSDGAYNGIFPITIYYICSSCKKPCNAVQKDVRKK